MCAYICLVEIGGAPNADADTSVLQFFLCGQFELRPRGFLLGMSNMLHSIDITLQTHQLPPY